MSNEAAEESPSREASPSKLLTVCPFILGNELCERLAYYGLATNLVNYLKVLGASSVTSAAANSIWTGFCYLFTILGGWISDSYLGRFMTILIFSIIYLLGIILLTGTSAIPGVKVEEGHDANAGQWTMLGIALLLLALGSGGIKPNVSSFGADQFDDTKEKDRNDKKSFFNWFYMFINIGAMIASTVIVYIQDQGKWDIGFGIPAAAFFVSVVLFVAGKPKYAISHPTESPIERFFKVTAVAIRNGRRRQPQPVPQENDNFAPLIEGSTGTKEHWLDRAVGPEDFSVEQVNEVKLVYGVFPVFFTSIIYWVVYVQIFGLFILQGNQMDREVSVFTIDFTMPAASMATFDTATIIVLVPIYELLVLPALKRLFNYKPTLLQRIGAGYFVAVLAMVSAYLIEHERKKNFENGEFRLGDEGEGENVKLSIWWQVLSYALVGASEVLAAIGMLEFFYDQAPDTMRSMMAALNLIGTGFGGYLSGVLLLVVNSISDAAGSQWLPDNLNHGHVDRFFLLIAGIMLCAFLWFLWIAVHYKYKHIVHAENSGAVVNEQRIMQNLGRSIAYHGEPQPTTAIL